MPLNFLTLQSFLHVILNAVWYSVIHMNIDLSILSLLEIYIVSCFYCYQQAETNFLADLCKKSLISSRGVYSLKWNYGSMKVFKLLMYVAK